MNRAKVIVHMYVSIDGKIDGKFMEEGDCEASGTYYDEQIFRMSKANGNGPTTCCLYAARGNADLSPYSAEGIDYEDYRGNVESDTWYVVFDRKGRCPWDVNYFDYAGKKSRAVEVVTRRAQKEYLAFLREKEIPYIVAGDRDLDLPLALRKLKEQYGLDTLALCGGAIINGAFLKQDCVDEISLVVAPYVDGEAQYQEAFNTLGEYVNTKFVFEKAVPLADGGVQLLFKKA